MAVPGLKFDGTDRLENDEERLNERHYVFSQISETLFCRFTISRISK